MNSKEYLNKEVLVKMDRPLGSVHHQHGFVYPVNYGSNNGVNGISRKIF